LSIVLRVYPRLNADHVVTDVNRPTAYTMRVISGSRQMVRVDAASRAEIAAGIEEAVTSALKDSLWSADVVVLSDYAKGLC
jgi:D-beta-D-heptose 7-phosphate kinase/D-beta-D-heptose 1-phosphate adenosyltransferase